MFLFATTENEIRDIIGKLHEKFSAGDDEICKALVKLSCSLTIPYLTDVINQSIIEGTFPNALKKTKIVPIHKAESKLIESNHRPISRLIVWSKIFERAMYNRVYGNMEKISLFCNQYRFLKKQAQWMH